MKRFTRKKAYSLHKMLTGIAQKVYNINEGGCGIFASYLYQILTAKGYRCRIVCLDQGPYRTLHEHLHNLRFLAKKDSDKAFAYNHFCLLIGGYYIDCGQLQRCDKNNYDIFDQYSRIGFISEDKLNYLVSLPHKWNDCYDRSQNNLLKGELDSLLMEI